MPILESEMPHEAMQQRVKTHKCAQCGSTLNVAWGGSLGYNEHILRCQDISHNTITSRRKKSETEIQGEKLFKELNKMDTKTLHTMSKTDMEARVTQARFVKDLQPKERVVLAMVAVNYGLDPLLDELTIYQGHIYPTINAYYRKAQETGQFDGINTQPSKE